MAAAVWRVPASAHPFAAPPVELDEPAVSWFERMLLPQISAKNDLCGGERSHVKRTSCCLHVMDEMQGKMTGFCTLNVFNKMSGAFFPSVTDWRICKWFFFPPAYLQWWRCDILQQHKPFISPIQKKYKSRIVPHSFCCRSATIKHPQVEVLCGGVKNLCVWSKLRKKNNGDIL